MNPPARNAMILAGGRGTRLAPFTTVLPKPLLPIGNRAILEVVVKQLAAAGFRDQTFAVGYLAHLIEAVFKDGSEYGVDISYLHEATRNRYVLGTARSFRTATSLLHNVCERVGRHLLVLADSQLVVVLTSDVQPQPVVAIRPDGLSVSQKL